MTKADRVSRADPATPVDPATLIDTTVETHRKIWGLDRNVFFTGVTSFFMDVSSEMVYSIVPIFLSSVLHVDKAILVGHSMGGLLSLEYVGRPDPPPAPSKPSESSVPRITWPQSESHEGRTRLRRSPS